MGSAKRLSIKAYVHLPKGVRRYTDPILRHRYKAKTTFEQRSQRGKEFLKNQLMKSVKQKRRKRP